MEKSLLVGDFLFVSKFHYGARIPMTPLAFPFAHHTMPLIGGKAYLDWIHLPYFRLPGISSIHNGDVVVFNWPMDADPPNNRPVDKCENYIKRCVGIPGDTLIIKNGVLFVNKKRFQRYEGQQDEYVVYCNNAYGVSEDDLSDIISGRYPEMMTSGEIGCITSHLKAIKYWYETSDSEAAFIFEDDFFINEPYLEKNKFVAPAQIAAGQPGWVAMVQHYFASAWIPDTKLVRDIYSGRLDNGLYRVGMQSQLGTIATGTTITANAQLFVGPQEERMLEKIAPGFELLKDYGYLTILAKPIFWLLEHIHNIVGNWGWSIILLTILIKLVFFPLSAASYKSMARMKEVQPRLMAMKEQYKGEPQKLNQAMMEMYRKEKINPLGGCLPVLIQIPVFISLYWVLLSSVEMRGAPWVLWIHDLSVPDPYYILPVIMAVSMFVQTKLNPTPPDPVQAKVMLYMPIVFSIMFFFFPAGLVLYWVVNNLLSIAQQWQINKLFGKKTAK